MRRRTRARELSLQFLYTLEVRGDDARSELPDFLTDAKAAVEVRAFVERMVDGVIEQREALDARIKELAENWKFDRIARVDRNILRLAAFELLHGDVPAPVVLDEAIELGKRYSTAQSGGFVNGILDRLLQSIPEKSTETSAGGRDGKPRRRRPRRGRKPKASGDPGSPSGQSDPPS